MKEGDSMKKLITQEELLEMAGISRALLYRDIQNGKIRCIKLSRNINRFYEEDAKKYAEEKKKRGLGKGWKS